MLSEMLLKLTKMRWKITPTVLCKVLICGLFISPAVANPQLGSGVPLPDGEAPDGTKYKTAYRCEGQDLRISCDPGQTIQVIRANYGRFSIAICNKNGYTDWSVNCMSHTTTRILQRKCDGEAFCDIEVNSGVFGDPCPNTHKYVEVHFACSSKFGHFDHEGTTKKLPPWFLQGSASSLWTSDANIQFENQDEISDFQPVSSERIPSKPNPRKPILVALDAVETTQKSTETSTKRIPITTPKPRPSFAPINGGESETTTTIRVKKKPNAESTPTNEYTTISAVEQSESTLPQINENLFFENHCPPIYARNLLWNWTRAGDVAIQPCPLSSTGLARWSCDSNSLTFTGLQPDMSDCKSLEVSDLETKVREEDPENVIVSSLERLTEKTGKLYGGDLEAVVNVLKAVLNRLQYLLQTKAESIYNKESFLQEIFQNVLRTGSNLMANQSLPAWRDLSRSRRIKVASNLIQTLEEHAFLLLSVIEQPEVIQESTKEIAVALSVIDTSSSNFLAENWTRFPYLEGRAIRTSEEKNTVNSEKTISWGPKWIANLTDVIGISNRAIKDQIKHKLVFSSYANLHKLLSDADQQISSSPKSAMLDSHIISASFLKHSQVQVPVEITFQHLNQDLNKRICVFWDVSEENWSEKGCQLIQSNQSHTQCGCQHLTHFALLALVDDPTLVGSGLDFGLIQANEGPEKESVITLEIATYLVSSICLLILLILSIQFRHQIKRGLQKTPCCKHRIKTASRQPDDDVIDKTHHQMYASTASITHNNGIQLTLEQTLAPASSTTSGSAGSSGSTSSTGTNSSGAGEGSNGKVGSPIHNAFYLNNLRSAPIPQNHIPPPYLNHNQFRPNPAAGPVSLPASVRATPTADFELYPRHLRTNSYTQATQHHFNNNSQQQFALRQLRNSDSCNSITQANSSRQQPHQLLYDKLHGRQSSSSAADDTEYGYHSASSSSAEHHAQLGPIQQQMVNQQQNYIQGQAQSHVGYEEQEKPTRGQHFIRRNEPPMYPTSHYPVVEAHGVPASYGLPTGGFMPHHHHPIYAGQPV